MFCLWKDKEMNQEQPFGILEENIKMKEKHKVNWFQALCCLLFWIILIKVFIDVCLKIGGLVGLISSM